MFWRPDPLDTTLVAAFVVCSDSRIRMLFLLVCSAMNIPVSAQLGHDSYLMDNEHRTAVLLCKKVVQNLQSAYLQCSSATSVTSIVVHCHPKTIWRKRQPQGWKGLPHLSPVLRLLWSQDLGFCALELYVLHRPGRFQPPCLFTG